MLTYEVTKIAPMLRFEKERVMFVHLHRTSYQIVILQNLAVDYFNCEIQCVILVRERAF